MYIHPCSDDAVSSRSVTVRGTRTYIYKVIHMYTYISMQGWCGVEQIGNRQRNAAVNHQAKRALLLVVLDDLYMYKYRYECIYVNTHRCITIYNSKWINFENNKWITYIYLFIYRKRLRRRCRRPPNSVRQLEMVAFSQSHPYWRRTLP